MQSIDFALIHTFFFKKIIKSALLGWFTFYTATQYYFRATNYLANLLTDVMQYHPRTCSGVSKQGLLSMEMPELIRQNFLF